MPEESVFARALREVPQAPAGASRRSLL